jgi:CRP-like cAMP-binding protein
MMALKFDPIVSYLTKTNEFIAKLDLDTLTALNQISVEKVYKKGDFLLRQDEICKSSYWVLNGIARKYYLNEGKEVTTELFFDDDIAVSFDSYCLQQPSREFIQALTDITVSQTDHGKFQTAKQQYPKLIILDLLMTEYYAMWLEERLFQFHTMDATTRYKQLLEAQPHIIQNIPLTYVASYLGISLETLSRIRAKI